MLESGYPPNNWESLLQNAKSEAQTERLEKLTTQYLSESEESEEEEI
jgi:hypothetical protein